ncbi:MAG: AAA family ATPase [Actinomycetia bacterium]|nr:AAA family ATPase [Actinomycetes bacterium]
MEPTNQSLAVTHRPGRFADVVGQRHVTVPMGRSIAAGRLASQVLLTGGSGLGKTTLARAAAAALLCETPLADRSDGDSCGTCATCTDVAAGNHIDVIELDAASNGGIDRIRELIQRAALGAMRADKKVYIVDEAHGITGAGSQAFLKLLEEPPAHTVWFLATTDPDKMIATIRGRCVSFELLPPPAGDLVDNLCRIADVEGWDCPRWVAERIVETSDPTLGIRGTVMGLERISALLAGDELDAGMVDVLLGVPGRTTIADLVFACESLDALDARDALAVARTQCSDAAIRDGLLDWARRGLATAGRDTLALAAYRLETALDIVAGPGRLDVAVAKLATVTVDADAEGVEVLAAAVTSLEERLANAGTDSYAHTPEAEPTPEARPAEPTTGVTGPPEVLEQLSLDDPVMAAEAEAATVRQVALHNDELWIGYADADAFAAHEDFWANVAWDVFETGLRTKQV